MNIRKEIQFEGEKLKFKYFPKPFLIYLIVYLSKNWFACVVDMKASGKELDHLEIISSLGVGLPRNIIFLKKVNQDHLEIFYP